MLPQTPEKQTNPASASTSDAMQATEEPSLRAIVNTWMLLSHEDAVACRDPDHYDVVSLHSDRRVHVVRRGEQWRCSVDKNSHLRPCSHVLAARYYVGQIELPNRLGARWTPVKEERNHGLETKAWYLQATEVPMLLSQMLNESIRLIAPHYNDWARGRPRINLFPLVYQSVMRCAQRSSMHRAEGAMETPLNRKYNPWGGVASSTISRFLSDAETTGILEQLLALSTWPARPYDLVHTNDKAWTHYYFDKLPSQHPKKDEPRLFTLAQVLWSHRYNLVVAARIQRGYFGDTFPGESLLAGAPVLMEVQADPIDKVSCRAHAATGAKSLRSRFRGKLMCQTERGQRNEFLSMAIAYNLSRLVYLQLREEIEIHFQPGAEILAARTP